MTLGIVGAVYPPRQETNRPAQSHFLATQSHLLAAQSHLLAAQSHLLAARPSLCPLCTRIIPENLEVSPFCIIFALQTAERRGAFAVKQT